MYSNGYSNTMKALIVEDMEIHALPLIGQLNSVSKEQGIPTDVVWAKNFKEAETYLKTNKYDIVFFDLHLETDVEGLSLLKRFKRKVKYPVVLTSYENNDIIKKAYHYGCKDYLVKPIDGDKIKYILKQYQTALRKNEYQELISNRFITQNEKLKENLNNILSLNGLNIPVHLNGPTGSGKQIIAELIHEIVKDDSGSLVELNCSTLNEGIVGSTLFGHVKGSFTGATGMHRGIFEMANGGTLFLDEIDKMPISIQDKFLKVIEQKEFTRVGDSKTKIKSDFYLVTASSTDLDKLIEKGLFRRDLKERLTGETISIPPLEKRKEDIPLLLNHFIRNHPSGRMLVVSDEAMNFIRNYWWPGNVRELKALVDKWMVRKLTEVKFKDLNGLSKKMVNSRYRHIGNNAIDDVARKGLDNYLEDMSMEIFDYFFRKNNNSVRNTMRDLKISQRKMYKLKELYEKKESFK